MFVHFYKTLHPFLIFSRKSEEMRVNSRLLHSALCKRQLSFINTMVLINLLGYIFLSSLSWYLFPSVVCLTWLCCELVVNNTNWTGYNPLRPCDGVLLLCMYKYSTWVWLYVCVRTVGLSALAWAFSWGETLQGASFSHKHHLSTTGSPASKHLAQDPSPRSLSLTHRRTHTSQYNSTMSKQKIMQFPT